MERVKGGMETFLHNVVLFVGDGRRLNFWKDKWCGEVALRVSFPSLFALAVNKEAIFLSKTNMY